MQLLHTSSATLQAPPSGFGSNKQVIMLRSEGLGVPLGVLEGLEVPLGGSRGPKSASGGLWGACGCNIR